MFQPTFDTKKEPNVISKPSECFEINTSWFLSKSLTWLVLRKFNGFDQNFATFSAWETDNKTKSMEFRDVKKTVETYLPPVDSKVTELKTIYKYLKYLQGLAADANMPFVNITLDVGAAINAYKVIWNYPEQFSNVLLDLGDFHLMK